MTADANTAAEPRMSFRKRVPLVVKWIVPGIVAAIVVAIAAGAALTAESAFFRQYEGLEDNFTALQAGGHSDLACNACHVDERGLLVYEAAVIADFYRGLFSRPETPAYVRLRTPTAGACLACHNEDWSDDASRTANVPHRAHLRVAEETRDCVECHKWTGHEEEYIDRHKEMPFSGVCASYGCHVGTKTTEECQTCHHAVTVEGPVWIDTHAASVRETGPSGCLESCHDSAQCQTCHTTGERPDFTTTTFSAAVTEVEVQHVKNDWMGEHGSWALDDDTVCFDCHVGAGECQNCHKDRPAFHGPESTWLNRHQEFTDDESDPGCLTCHEQVWCDECHDQFEEMR